MLRFCFGLSNIFSNLLLFLSSSYSLSFNLFHCIPRHFVNVKLPLLIYFYRNESQKNRLFFWNWFFWIVIQDRSSYLTNDNWCIFFWWTQKYSILLYHVLENMKRRLWQNHGTVIHQSIDGNSTPDFFSIEFKKWGTVLIILYFVSLSFRHSYYTEYKHILTNEWTSR